ncbi:hypothetical protein KL912_003563 [Ogataea haglerorum]|nr:hypothetical protein KL912_003563 [Ogataea haglerorum]
MQQLECAVETGEVEHDGCVFPTFLHRHSGDYKGRIVFIHGYRDIYELFFGLFNKLTADGYDVHFHYQRGEGTSRPASNVQSSNDDSRVYKDMDFFISRNLDADDKVILMGHSMGGGLILNYSAFGTYRDRLLMTVACSPLIELSPETAAPKYQEWAIRALCWAVPPVRYLRVKTPLKVEYVSSLPEVQQFIRSRAPPAGLTATAIEARDFPFCTATPTTSTTAAPAGSSLPTSKASGAPTQATPSSRAPRTTSLSSRAATFFSASC